MINKKCLENWNIQRYWLIANIYLLLLFIILESLCWDHQEIIITVFYVCFFFCAQWSERSNNNLPTSIHSPYIIKFILQNVMYSEFDAAFVHMFQKWIDSIKHFMYTNGKWVNK